MIQNAKIFKYKYCLLGEKHYLKINETIILYKDQNSGKQFEITAKKLCSMKNIISKFHPLDIRTISFIAGSEHFLEIPKIKPTKNFINLKNNLLGEPICN